MLLMALLIAGILIGTLILLATKNLFVAIGTALVMSMPITIADFLAHRREQKAAREIVRKVMEEDKEE